MDKIGIIVNLAKDSNLEFTISIINWLKAHKCKIMLSDSITHKSGFYEEFFSNAEIYEKADFVIVLGGDGTILGAAREAASFGKPLFGINMGHLGFMTDIEANDTFYALDSILNNNYEIEERMMLEATVMSGDIIKQTFYCLNEIGISRGTLSKMLTLKICISNEYYDTYHADGILVSTPTGSTAYSLSAGGPIINPKVNVILITPVCPHSLSARSLIVSGVETIDISIQSSFCDAFITADGQIGLSLSEGDRFIIKRSKYSTKLIKVSNRSFYDVLRTKLKERFI